MQRRILFGPKVISFFVRGGLLSSICSFSFSSPPFLLLHISSSPLFSLYLFSLSSLFTFTSFIPFFSVSPGSFLSLSLFPFYLLRSFPPSFSFSLLSLLSLISPLFCLPFSLSLSSTTCLYIRYTVAILCLIIYTIYSLIIDVVFLLSFSHI